MKILAVMDVHPIGEGSSRGLFARISKGPSGYFDLEITREQAGVLLTNSSSLLDEEHFDSAEDAYQDFSQNVVDPESVDGPYGYYEDDDL